MLKEKRDVRQIEGEGYRRWFADKYFDLIVWYEDESAETCVGFQLCYDKEGTERALTWSKQHGYSHTKVDDGENPYSSKMTPVLVSDGVFEHETVRKQFLDAADNLEDDLTAYIDDKLQAY
jgi:hypothetical protein